MFVLAALLGMVNLVLCLFATRHADFRPRSRHVSAWGLLRRYHPGVVLLVSAASLMFLGDGVVRQTLRTMELSFRVPRAELMDPGTMLLKLQQAIFEAVTALSPFFLVVTAAALLAPMALSGWSFSAKALAFKWDKLDPIKGLGRIFAVRGLVELVKALAKFCVVLAVAVMLLLANAETLLGLGGEDINPAIADTGTLLLQTFLLLSGAMIVIAVIDVPFQIWDHQKQLRMTRQEIKDEFKETDGNPEVKRRIREIRHEQSRRRMMDAVPKADVVITNPTHYAVALRYEQGETPAPICLAMGVDAVAARIREIAEAHDIPIVENPPLARALFATAEIDQPIPREHYEAVAKVIGVVMRLARRRRRRGALSACLFYFRVRAILEHRSL